MLQKKAVETVGGKLLDLSIPQETAMNPQEQARLSIPKTDYYPRDGIGGSKSISFDYPIVLTYTRNFQSLRAFEFNCARAGKGQSYRL